MRITTWNVNGLRSALSKGIERHLERLAPDVLLLQEIRVHPDQLPAQWVSPHGWHVHWNPAVRRGYAGTAVWSRFPIEVLGCGLDGADDPEGRLLLVKVQGVRLASIYLPSGSSGEHRQVEKDRWLGEFAKWAAPRGRSRVPTILAGDFNVAHTERDIYHWRSNQKTSGFLPHERQWIGDLFDSGWTDFVRAQAGDVDGPYTWWSNRGRARELDRGWRIDYVMGNRAAAKMAGEASIDREAGLAISDHAPVTIELDA